MFRNTDFLYFLDNNAALPHYSRYHQEGYKEHCLLVVDEVEQKTDDSALLIAACLHDIAKPRKQTWNKRGEASFKQHEDVTDEELSQFLTMDDWRFDYVKALVLCHMLPIRIAKHEIKNKTIEDACKEIFERRNIKVMLNDKFIADLMLLHQADVAGSIEDREMLKQIKNRCRSAYSLILNLR